MDDYNKYSVLGVFILSCIIARLMNADVATATGSLFALMTIPAVICAVIIWPVLHFFQPGYTLNTLSRYYICAWFLITLFVLMGSA